MSLLNLLRILKFFCIDIFNTKKYEKSLINIFKISKKCRSQNLFTTNDRSILYYLAFKKIK